MIMLNRPARGQPRTVDAAVDRILSVLTDADMTRIREMPAEDLDLLHFGLGAWIRNDFCLWAGNTDLLASCGSLGMSPDAASEVIIPAVWERIRE